MADTDVFVKEFMRHRSALMGYIAGVTGDFHLAEDIFQEVSVIAFQKQDTFTPGTSMGAWAREIARRKLLEERRKVVKAGLPLGEDTLAALEREFEAGEDRWEPEKEALRHCIRKLPVRLRTMLHLRYRGGMALDAIAGRVKSTAGAVQVALSRIRDSLAKCIRAFLAGGGA